MMAEYEMSILIMKIVLFGGVGIMAFSLVRKMFSSKVIMFVIGAVAGRFVMKRYGGRIMGAMDNGYVKSVVDKFNKDKNK